MTLNIKLREDFRTRTVVVYKDDIETYRRGEYSDAATWAKSKYSLSDEQLWDIYRDYKEDFENEK